MFVLKTFLFIYTLFTVTEGKFGDNLKKCSINDDDCLKSIYQNLVSDAAKGGISDISIPPLDPLKVRNVTVNIFDTVTGSLLDTVIKGIGNCVIEKLQINVKKQITRHDITCDLSVKGILKLYGKNPTIQAILGSSSVDVYGKGGLKLDKLSLKFESPFDLYKKEDEKIYLKLDDTSVKYQYNLQNAEFWAEKITVGKEDISKTGISYLNQNWRFIVQSFGNIFLDKAVPVYFNLLNQFYGAVPLNNYITEDLSSYLEE